MTVLKRIFTFLVFLFYAIIAVGTIVVLAINFYWSYMFSVSLQNTIVGTQWHYGVDPISQVNYKKIIFTDSENFTFTYRVVGLSGGSFIDGSGGEINGQWFVDENGKIELVWCHALVYGLCPKEPHKDCLLCLQEERAIAQITGPFTIMLNIEGDLHSLSDNEILGEQHEFYFEKLSVWPLIDQYVISIVLFSSLVLIWYKFARRMQPKSFQMVSSDQ